MSRRFWMNRRTIYHRIETGQPDRDPSVGARGHSPRPLVPHKLGPYKGIIDACLKVFLKLSAKRLFDQIHAEVTMISVWRDRWPSKLKT